MKTLTNYPSDFTKPIDGESQETHISWSKSDRLTGVAYIYTDDPVEYRKLLKKGYAPIAVTESHAKFKIEYRLVSIRNNKPKRKVSEAERERSRQHMMRIHKAKEKAVENSSSPSEPLTQ